MKNNRELTDYMNGAVEQLAAEIGRAALKNPRETLFLLRWKKSLKAAAEKRLRYEAEGLHIPVFLISSITKNCNLFCRGCYARANGICGEQSGAEMLTAEEWRGIFAEARELGIAFNLLAGGEPLLRREVIEAAAEFEETLFPVFTNGTLLQEAYITLFDRHRNLVPVLSLEGGAETTDERRGPGVYGKLVSAMEAMHKKGLLYGVSVTVTAENLEEVTSPAFIGALWELGCRVVFFIEYVPVDKAAESLALGEEGRARLELRQDALREEYGSMVLVSFPGDEKYSGGCLAGGRGFFHINADGAAEACPFSPYSDTSVKTQGLLQAVRSPFFQKLREEGLIGGEHTGGCVLFEREEQVKSLLG